MLSPRLCTSGLAIMRETSSRQAFSTLARLPSSSKPSSDAYSSACSSSLPKYWFDEMDVAPWNCASRARPSKIVAGSYPPHSKNMSLEIAFEFPKRLWAVVGMSSATSAAVELYNRGASRRRQLVSAISVYASTRFAATRGKGAKTPLHAQPKLVDVGGADARRNRINGAHTRSGTLILQLKSRDLARSLRFGLAFAIIPQLTNPLRLCSRTALSLSKVHRSFFTPRPFFAGHGAPDRAPAEYVLLKVSACVHRQLSRQNLHTERR